MPAVLHHNLQAEDGRFAQLAFALTGNVNLNELVKCFEELNAVMQVRERVREYVPNLTSLLNLEDQMFDPGRASNNIAEISILKPILANSWDGFGIKI
jgi:alcohol dehydrogenase